MEAVQRNADAVVCCSWPGPWAAPSRLSLRGRATPPGGAVRNRKRGLMGEEESDPP